VRFPPAIYSQSISVGATDASDRIAGFSSRGPVGIRGSNLPAPDLAAPGVGVKSSLIDDRYGLLNGTSMAAPHVAGAIALLWSAQPALIGQVAVTEQLLRASATPIEDYACGGDLDGQPNNVYGWGLINVDSAVQMAESLIELGGTVKDTQGSPLSAAQVTVTDLTWGVEINLMTNPEGHYTTPLLPGVYRVSADTLEHFFGAGVVTVAEATPTTHDVSLIACLDWNGDGVTGLFEIQSLANDWQARSFASERDLNKDGEVNVIDVALLTVHFEEPCSGPAS
jgi:hypothetical protein